MKWYAQPKCNMHAEDHIRLLHMVERNITGDELLAVIDTGDTRFKDNTHLWVYKHLTGRCDNLICAVLVLETAVVVKTVMHEFIPEV